MSLAATTIHRLAPVGFIRLMLALGMLMSSGVANADCFDEAAGWQHVNANILRAIAWQESHWRADAVHLNANGSIDYGVMQINTIHLPELARYNIGRNRLMSACENVFIAAWQLRKEMNLYGNTWKAVGAYHSATPALRDDYALHIFAILKRWHVITTTGAPVVRETAAK
jgi:soluble lytic murein transglycosylase-like protein